MTESKVIRFTFQTHHSGSYAEDRSSYMSTAKIVHTEIIII